MIDEDGNEFSLDEIDEPDFVQHVANLLGSSDTGEDQIPTSHAVTVRLPLATYARLTVLTTRAGISRNAMTNLVLKAGFQAIAAATDPEIAYEIQEETNEKLRDLAGV